MAITQKAVNIAIASLRHAGSHNAIKEILANLASALYCQYFQIIPAPNNNIYSNHNILEFGNYPEELKKIYEKEESAILDPVRFYAISHIGAFKWRKIFLNIKTKSEREFIKNLRLLNIIDGISVPIHGPSGCMAILCFASSQIINLESDIEESLSFFAIILMQAISRIMEYKKSNSKNYDLTNREKEALKWAIEGKTNWEIGVLMGVSARTAQFHITNCQTKLGVSNRTQAAIKAVTNGIIKIDDYRPYETKSFNYNNMGNYYKLEFLNGVR